MSVTCHHCRADVPGQAAVAVEGSLTVRQCTECGVTNLHRGSPQAVRVEFRVRTRTAPDVEARRSA